MAPICMVIGATPASIVYNTNNGRFTGPTTNTSWSFSLTPIGTATATRLVIVGAFYINTAASAATCTIGGISATEITACHIRTATGSGTETELRLFAATVPTGTSATVVVNTGTATGCWIGVWSAYDLISTTAVDTAKQAPAGTTVTLDLNVSAGGVACGMGLTPNAVTWTGFAEDFDRINTVWTSGGSVESAAGATPMTVRVATSPGTGSVMCAASFR